MKAIDKSRDNLTVDLLIVASRRLSKACRRELIERLINELASAPICSQLWEAVTDLLDEVSE